MSPRWRDFFGLFLVLLLLAAMGGLAWLTRHPEATILAEAQTWPVIGPVAKRLRDAYLPSPSPMIEELAEEPGEEPEIFVPPPVGAQRYVWIKPGAILREEPSQRAPSVGTVTVYANLSLLEQRGDWFKVWRRGLDGWVYLEGYSERMARGEPPLGNAPDPPKALPPAPPDSVQLAKAREFLGEGEKHGSLGPYELYTDCQDAELLVKLGKLAEQIEEVYQRRYGLRPLGQAQAAIVLYQSEGSYRTLQARSDRLIGLRATGHAAHGFAALYVGRRSRLEVATTLIHELVHLLNRRALGPALPPWLDEGLADDLALARVDDDGYIQPEELSSVRQQEGSQVTFYGGVAALIHLRDRVMTGSFLPLPELVALDWSSFVRNPNSQTLYAQSMFFVRYLLDGERGLHRVTFQAFLQGVAGGEPIGPEALQDHLGKRLTVLDAGLRTWISFQAMKVQ